MTRHHAASWLVRWGAGWKLAERHPSVWQGILALLAAVALVWILTRLFRRRSEPAPQAVVPAWPGMLVVAACVGGYWYYRAHPAILHAAAKPAPAPTRTVIIHQAARAAAHSPVSGTDVVLIVVAALVAFVVIFLNDRKG